jgi:hypothetical protein
VVGTEGNVRPIHDAQLIANIAGAFAIVIEFERGTDDEVTGLVRAVLAT